MSSVPWTFHQDLKRWTLRLSWSHHKRFFMIGTQLHSRTRKSCSASSRSSLEMIRPILLKNPPCCFLERNKVFFLNVGVWAKNFRAPAARDLYRFTKKNIARRRRAKIFGSKNVQNVIFNRFPMINDVKSTKIFRCAAIYTISSQKFWSETRGVSLKGGVL